MTNLHLGGARGDLDGVRGAVEAAGARWAGALDVCERAAACFPGTLCVGVDLLPAIGWRRLRRRRGQRLRRPAAAADRTAGQRRRRAWTPTARRCAGRPLRAPRPAADPHVTRTEQRTAPLPEPDMNAVVGSHDLLLVTLDTLRLRRGRRAGRRGAHPAPRPAICPADAGRSGTRRAASRTPRTRRSSPGSCRLPPRPARTRGCSRRGSRAARRPPGGTFVFDTPDLVSGLAAVGLPHGVRRRRGLLQQAGPARLRPARPVPGEPLGAGVRRGLAAPPSRTQVARAEQVVAELPAEQRLFLFVNVSALHQPNWFHLPGATPRDGRHPGRRTPPRWSTSTGTSGGCSPRRAPAAPASPSSAPTTAPPTATTATPATASGHEAVWTVPYAHFFLDPPRPPDDHRAAAPAPTAATSTRIRTRRPTARSTRPARAARRCGRRRRADALSLYLHIPFCEVRCGFCNLFTRIGAPDGADRRLPRRAGAAGGRRPGRARRRGAGAVRHRGVRRRHARPSSTAAELERLCDIAERRMGADLRAVPLSVEASPADGHRGPARRPRRARRDPAQHRRAELRRRRGPGRRTPAAPRRRRGRARPDPGHRHPGPQHRPDLRHRRPDRAELARLPGRGPGLAARGAVPLPALRPPADRPRPASPGTPEPTRRGTTQRLRLYRAGRDHLLAHGLRAGVDADVPPGRRPARRAPTTTPARRTA